MTALPRGMDYNGGGARYNTKYLQGVGIGTITDALASIKYNVYDEHRFTMGELMQALDDDFEGHEELLNQVRSRTPKYGNDDDYADEIMKAVFASFRSMVSGRPEYAGRDVSHQYAADDMPCLFRRGDDGQRERAKGA